MERIVKQSLLYDFYGELLTEHQRRIYEDVVFNDLSPSEIAEAHGISRQGVHEMVKRCDRILEEMESKLHLMEKNQKLRELAELILRRSEAADSPEKALEEVRQWASLLLEDL